MRRLAADALLAFVLSAGVAVPARAACDRACLEQVADGYLKAVVGRKPGALPTTATVRYTENGQTLKLGDGLWATAERLGDYRIVVPDAVQQEVGVAAQVIESGQPALVSTRIKAVDGRISEIETLVSRKEAGGMGKQDDLHVRPGLIAPLTPAERVPRAEMIAAADGYFVGLERATDKFTKFDPACVRFENGMQTTSNPAMGNNISAADCRAQFALGFSPFITGLRDRRYLVDEQTGIVFALLFFDHAGTVKSVKLTNGETMVVPPPFNRPFSFQLFEMFKIVRGRIREVEAALNAVPYGMRSGWPRD